MLFIIQQHLHTRKSHNSTARYQSSSSRGGGRQTWGWERWRGRGRGRRESTGCNSPPHTLSPSSQHCLVLALPKQAQSGVISKYTAGDENRKGRGIISRGAISRVRCPAESTRDATPQFHNFPPLSSIYPMCGGNRLGSVEW